MFFLKGFFVVVVVVHFLHMYPCNLMNAPPGATLWIPSRRAAVVATVKGLSRWVSISKKCLDFFYYSFLVSLSPCLHAHTSIPPSSVSLSVSMLPPCLRLSLPLFAFNSWGHPGPLGSYPRMLSRLTSRGVAFWTEQAVKPRLDQHSDSTTYSAIAPPKKSGIFQGSLVEVVILNWNVICTGNLWWLTILHLAL